MEEVRGLTDHKIVYWAETFTSYQGKINAAVALGRYELTYCLVIVLMYIGYNVWDIPLDYSPVLGNKYAYAVRNTDFLGLEKWNGNANEL